MAPSKIEAGKVSKDGVYLAYVGGYTEDHLEPVDSLKPGERGFMMVAPGATVTAGQARRFERAVERKNARESASAASERAPFGPDSDPADYTVQEVVAYLEGADDAEKTRVQDAEAAGKGRTGILNA